MKVVQANFRKLVISNSKQLPFRVGMNFYYQRQPSLWITGKSLLERFLPFLPLSCLFPHSHPKRLRNRLSGAKSEAFLQLKPLISRSQYFALPVAFGFNLSAWDFSGRRVLRHLSASARRGLKSVSWSVPPTPGRSPWEA